jgi:peptidoglycan glycosyltransferase
MNRSLRRLAAVLLMVFAVIAVDVTYLQVVAGPRYRDDPRNARVVESRIATERGPILTRENVVVARSTARPDNPEAFDRSYPEGSLYGHVAGYSSLLFGDTGIEAAYADELSSGRTGTISAVIDALLGRASDPLGVRLTVSHAVQNAAAAALGDQRGAVVALDPATGAVLALYSSPTFDPTVLLGGDPEPGDALAADPAKPLLNRAIGETYAPGSSFKVVTTAAGLESGAVNPDTTFPDPAELELPGSTATIRNFDRNVCGDGVEVSLTVAFRRSCNTVFGALGMQLGADRLIGQAVDFGFRREIPFDLPTIASAIPEAVTFTNDLPALAQTAIGQRDVRATALQMALVAAAVANEGRQMTPYLVEETFDRDLNVEQVTEPVVWQRAMSPGTALVLAELMEDAVANGTGRAAGIEGTRVAGKTGTAEVPGAAPHAWFIGFAPVEAPQIAVAVVVENGGALGDEATGGSVAAPIARAVMRAWIETSREPIPLQSPG